MKIAITKNNIVYGLLILVILLLAVNIIIEKYFRPSREAVKKEISSVVINERFLNSLNNYNIDSAWIKKQKVSGGDSLKYNYFVELPADLPASLLLCEIQNQFDTNEVDISAEELKSRNSTGLNISSGGNLKLKALFKYYTSISRQADTLGFVLTGIEDLNNEELKELCLMPEHFAGVIIPSTHSYEIMKTLRENQKEAAVLLNDDISELAFRLKAGYTAGRIRSSLKSIIGKFYNTAFFIIDQNSDIFKSDHYKMIRDEFSKRHLILVKQDRFLQPGNLSPEDIIRAVNSGANTNRLLLISAGKFLELPPLLETLRKRGYKFVSPSELIRD